MNTPHDWSLERYRPLLLIQARRLQRDPRLQARFDPSEIVQDTFVKALENRAQCKAITEPEWIKWLQVILGNVLADRVRYEKAGKRDVNKDRQIRQCVKESSLFLLNYPAAQGPSPSEQVERREQLLRMAAAIEQLPEDKREVVERHAIWGDSIKEIATNMKRTEKSIAGLYSRGISDLRRLME